ncbi:hypothetical protein DPMN_107050 [Dreissena polymorpha]|uniref:Ig-like domain-containing protein n=1 Tax=Dreissena polymorpha TaxID=45954 RepID=A0A9D4K623_DREPO|nr:hypothetical protein DPMN_107050 [Dreissena polymorpha]
MVVWLKVRTSFPLTSGTLTVVADKRFHVGHIDFKSHWDLMIKNVKLEDDGVYECQISSKDRTVRRLITLNVVDPVVEAPEIRITGLVQTRSKAHISLRERLENHQALFTSSEDVYQRSCNCACANRG